MHFMLSLITFSVFEYYKFNMEVDNLKEYLYSQNITPKIMHKLIKINKKIKASFKIMDMEPSKKYLWRIMQK